MDVDPVETANAAAEEKEQKSDRAASQLTTWVAITVALLATFLGVCKVKDENIVKAMERAESERLDHWNFYQARNIREEVARATLAQLKLARAMAPADKRVEFGNTIAVYEKLAEDQASKKEDVKVEAENDDKTYTALKFRDDQFNLSDASIAIAISLLAVTALTKKRWLYWAALVPTAFGIVMGIAGFAGLNWHPESFIQFLR